MISASVPDESCPLNDASTIQIDQLSAGQAPNELVREAGRRRFTLHVHAAVSVGEVAEDSISLASQAVDHLRAIVVHPIVSPRKAKLHGFPQVRRPRDVRTEHVEDAHSVQVGTEHLVAGKAESLPDQPAEVKLYVLASRPAVECSRQDDNKQCLELLVRRRPKLGIYRSLPLACRGGLKLVEAPHDPVPQWSNKLDRKERQHDAAQGIGSVDAIQVQDSMSAAGSTRLMVLGSTYLYP